MGVVDAFQLSFPLMLCVCLGSLKLLVVGVQGRVNWMHVCVVHGPVKMCVQNIVCMAVWVQKDDRILFFPSAIVIRGSFVDKGSVSRESFSVWWCSWGLKYSPHYDVSSLCAVGTGGYANSVNIAREKRCPQFSDWPSFYGFPTVSDKQRRRSRPTRSNKGHSPGFTIFTNSSPSFRFPAQIDPIRPTLFVWGMGGVETLFQTKIDGFWTRNSQKLSEPGLS